MVPGQINLEAVQKHIGPNADARSTPEERGRIYQELLGFVPPRIQGRFHVTGALDPEMVELQERVRTHAMYPKHMDVKTAQLMLFGMLLMDGNDAVMIHAIAARRAGASWHEMQETINLCYLFRGMSAANKGAEILGNLAQREEEQANAAAAKT